MTDTREILRRGIGDYEPTIEGYEQVLRRRDRKRRNRRVGAFVVATAIVAAGAAAFWSGLRADPVPAGPTPSGLVVFSATYVEPVGGAVSRNSTRDLYLVREGAEPRLIAGSSGDQTDQFCPSISPDGTKLAYIAQGRDGATLLIAPIDESGVLGAPAAQAPVHPPSLNPCPRWAPQGDRVALVDEDTPLIVGVDGTETVLDGINGVSELEWSPAGDQIAVRHDPTVSVIDLGTGSDRVVAGGLAGADVRQLTWSAEGLAIGASAAPHGQPPANADAYIRIVDVVSGDERDVSVGPHGWVASVTWLPDGRIVFTDATSTRIVDPSSDVAPIRIVGAGGAANLSSDGRSILSGLSSGDGRGYALFSRPVDGGPAVRLTPWSGGLEYTDFDW